MPGGNFTTNSFKKRFQTQVPVTFVPTTMKPKWLLKIILSNVYMNARKPISPK